LNECIERSLRRMGIEHIDVYQVHRPDPLTHPRETARALNDAVKTGKVLHVGVSNYYPEQVRALQTYLDVPLVSNQFEVHPLRLDPVYEGWQVPSSNTYGRNDPGIGDGVLDQCMAMNMTPLAYSPLAGGRLTRQDEEVGEKSAVEEDISHEVKVRRALHELATKYNATPVQVALAWLTNHPSKIVPLVGSANPEHIREAAGSANLKIEREDWFAVWKAGWNRNVP
jgi:predicted oxidoreductase